MSRKECKHGRTCCHELCPLEDNVLIGIECSGYEDSGYRRSILTYQEARERMDRKLLKLKELESIKVTFENGKELSKKIYQVKKSIRLLQRIYYKIEFFKTITHKQTKDTGEMLWK